MKFKNLLCPIGLLFLIASCTSETSKSEQETVQKSAEKPTKPTKETLAQYDLVPGRAGQLWVNMPSDSLKKLVPTENLTPTERELEGTKITAYEIRNKRAGNQLLLLAEENCEKNFCKIFRIRVISPKFKTKEGIRVGATFGEVKKLYPISFTGLGEADFVAISETQKMTFTLDISNFPPKPLYKIKQSDIPDNAAVTSILLF